MTWPVIASMVLRVTVIFTAAAATAAMLRRGSAAARHLVWTVAIAASLVVPALSTMLPHWNVGLLPAAIDRPFRQALTQPPIRAASDDRLVSAAGTRTRAAQVTPVASEAAQERGSVPTARDRYSALFLASVAWLAGVLIVLLRLALGTAWMAWIARGARPVREGAWGELAGRLATSLGIRTTVVFLEGTSHAMPVAWGLFRHRVLLPQGAANWPFERQKVVLLHELAHVKRHDCLTQLIAQIACAVYWFNPLAWMASSRLRKEREHACDDLVLACGTRGAEYADHLLDIARSLRTSAPPTWAAVAMAHRSQLEGRLMAILDPAMVRRSLTRRSAVAIGVVFTVLAVTVALVSPLAKTTFAAASPSQVTAAVPDSHERQSLPTPTPTPAPSPAPAPRSFTTEIIRGVAEAIPDAINDVLAESIGGGVKGGVKEGVKGGVKGGVHGGIRGGVRDEKQSTADPKVVAALIEALKDTDVEVRKQALLTLAQVGAKEAVEPIRAATRDADPDVRRQAVFALGQFNDPASYDDLVNALADANASVAEQGAFALGELGDKRAVGPLTTALKSSRSADVRKQCAFALGEIGDATAVDALVAALRDNDTEVRAQAAFALGEIGDARASDALMAALKDTNPQVRRQAAFALSQIEK